MEEGPSTAHLHQGVGQTHQVRAGGWCVCVCGVCVCVLERNTDLEVFMYRGDPVQS